MKIALEPTGHIENVNGNPCRKWIGLTDKGVEVHAWIATISPQTHDEAVAAEFASELREVKGERRLTSYDIRLFLD